MMTASGAPVTGVRKAAIALVALGEESAASIFKFLGEHEIESIAREIASLGNVPMDLSLIHI